MIRSRVTLARIDAAATHATDASPFQTAVVGMPRPGTGKPSVSAYAGRTARCPTARRMPARLATCRPQASISAAGMTTTDQATARRTTSLVELARDRRGEQLGVGEPVDAPAPAGRQHARGDDQRPGARAAAGLVRAGDRAETGAPQGGLVVPQRGLGERPAQDRGGAAGSAGTGRRAGMAAMRLRAARVRDAGPGRSRPAPTARPARRSPAARTARCCAAVPSALHHRWPITVSCSIAVAEAGATACRTAPVRRRSGRSGRR